MIIVHGETLWSPAPQPMDDDDDDDTREIMWRAICDVIKQHELELAIY